MEVVTAAIPTKAWNPATVWGRSARDTFLPIPKPTKPPTPNNDKAYIKIGAGKFMAVKVVTIPPNTPI
jgi:hypothetical protein